MSVFMAVEHCTVWLFTLRQSSWWLGDFQGMIDEDLPEQLSPINKTALRTNPGSTLCLNTLPLRFGTAQTNASYRVAIVKS